MTLLAMIAGGVKLRYSCIMQRSIKWANAVLKKGKKMWILLNLRLDNIRIRQLDKVVIKGW